MVWVGPMTTYSILTILLPFSRDPISQLIHALEKIRPTNKYMYIVCPIFWHNVCICKFGTTKMLEDRLSVKIESLENFPLYGIHI